MFNEKLSIESNHVNKENLLKAIERHFCYDVEILKISVHDNNGAFVTEFDGICVTQWYFKDVCELIHCYFTNVRYRDCEITQIL